MRRQVGQRRRGQIGQHLRRQVGQRRRGQIGQHLRGQVGQRRRGQIGQHLRRQVGQRRRGQIGQHLRRQVGQRRRGQIGQHLRGQIGQHLRRQVGQVSPRPIGSCLPGHVCWCNRRLVGSGRRGLARRAKKQTASQFEQTQEGQQSQDERQDDEEPTEPLRLGFPSETDRRFGDGKRASWLLLQAPKNQQPAVPSGAVQSVEFRFQQRIRQTKILHHVASARIRLRIGFARKERLPGLLQGLDFFHRQATAGKWDGCTRELRSRLKLGVIVKGGVWLHPDAGEEPFQVVHE